MKRLLPILFTLILFGFGSINTWYYFVPSIALAISFKKLRFAYNSLLIALIGVEIILRSFSIIPMHYRSFELLNEQDPNYVDLHRLKPNSEILMQEIGDLGAMSGNPNLQIKKEILTVTDDLGFRNYPDQRKKQNKYLILGDSYALGIGLSQEETIPSRMENAYNLGFPGDVATSTARYLCYRNQINLEKDHQVILLFFEGNDYNAGYLPTYTPEDRSTFEKTTSIISSFRKRSPLRNLYTKVRFKHFDKSFENNVISNEQELKYLPYQNEINHQEFNGELVHENFQFLKKQVEDYGGNLSVAIIPSKSSYLKTDRRKKELIKILSKLKIKCIDIRQHFIKMELKTQDIWWQDDTHFNQFGAATTANILVSKVK